ncbi:hypothetical protein ACLESO_09220 [Pyxidicoccus sp. 3LG]
MGVRSTTTAATTTRTPTPLRTGNTPVPTRPLAPALPQRAPLANPSRDSFVSAPTSCGPNLTGAERTAPLTEALPSSMAMRAVSTGSVQQTTQGGGVSMPYRIRLDHLTQAERQQLTPRELLIQFAMQFHKVDRAGAEALVDAKPPQVSWTKGAPQMTDALRNGAFVEITVTDFSLEPLSTKDDKAVDGLLNGLPPGDQKRLKGDALKDYASVLRAAQTLSKLSPFELADYLSKTTGTTSDWGALEKSVNTYLADRAERLKGLETLQGYSKRLEGTAALYQRLAKAREYEAKAVEAERAASTLLMGADSPSMQPPQLRKQSDEARREAASFRALARQEAAQLSREHPILKDEKLDLRTLVQAKPERIQSLIQEHLASRRQDIRATRANIEKDPSLVYGFDVLLKTSKQVQDIQPGSVQDLVINDRDAELRFNQTLIDVGLSAMGLAAGLLSGGSALLPIIVAGGIDGAQVVRKAQDYMVKDAAFGAGLLKDDPTMADVVLAVVETGFDLAAAGPIFDAVKAFRMSRVKDLAKLEKDLEAVPDIGGDLVKRVVDAERRGLSQGVTDAVSQATKDVDTAVKDLRQVMRRYASEEVDGAALRAAYLRAVDDVGGDPRVRARLESLKDPVLREVFSAPEALLAAASSKDPKMVDELLKLLDRQVGRDSADVVMSDAVRNVARKPKAALLREVSDPKEIERLFREKYGDGEAVFYRSIRVSEGGKLQGAYKGAQDGQLLSNSKSAALTYANQAPGPGYGRKVAATSPSSPRSSSGAGLAHRPHSPELMRSRTRERLPACLETASPLQG